MISCCCNSPDNRQSPNFDKVWKETLALEATEIRKMAALEDAHWWYRERRALLARLIGRLPQVPGRRPRAIDVGAGAGGNTRVLAELGWRSLAVEYGQAGAQLAADRGLTAVRADARALPLRSGSMDLAVAFDVLEHIEQDFIAATELRRVLRPGGTALISVPCDLRLWSSHDEAVDHFRRYSRRTLRKLLEQAGFVIDELWSWNVLLRPVARWHKRRVAGADLQVPRPFINRGLESVLAAERYLPVRRLPGVSLLVRAHVGAA